MDLHPRNYFDGESSLQSLALCDDGGPVDIPNQSCLSILHKTLRIVASKNLFFWGGVNVTFSFPGGTSAHTFNTPAPVPARTCTNTHGTPRHHAGSNHPTAMATQLHFRDFRDLQNGKPPKSEQLSCHWRNFTERLFVKEHCSTCTERTARV